MALVSAVCLAGCTRNTVVLMTPLAVQAVPPGVCREPADGPAATPAPAAISYDPSAVRFPAQAQAAGIRIGCGGILFRIDQNGRATDQRLMTEFPEGYGFGQNALSVLSLAQFATGVTDPNWHFARMIIRVLSVRAPAPSAMPSTTGVRPLGLMSERLPDAGQGQG